MTLAALALATVLAVTPTVDPWAPDLPVTRHTVRPGQTLSEIADRHDTPGGAYRLAYINRDRIAHPDLIEVGVTLRLPTTNGRKWIPRPEPKASRSSTVTQSSSSSPSPGPSHSSGGDVWSQLAACESGGRWDYNGSSGFDGGLQFLPSTWLAYGGGQYAEYAWQASPAEQIAVAEKVLAGQGWGAWPSCADKLGLR